ncbi:MAG: amidohydrolase family protein [Nonomuraea sp.]|nr:amidohydrolase family protein [Nonomuraea sp.]NUP62835.1 amidohydrolase family protein [Nonomuraea sp.]NUS00961.1 amidohydrolase family protein [Nonomuraea sp.]
MLTFDAGDSRAAGLAVRGGRVVAVGPDERVRAYAGPDTRVLSLAGRTVLPGINDSHLHAAWLGAVWPDTLISENGLSAHPGRLLADEDARRAAVLRAGRICASLGITSYTEPGLGPGEDDGETGCFSQAVLDTYATLAKEGELRTRVTALRLFGVLDGPSTLAAVTAGLRAPLPPSDPSWLNVAGIKIFADGIPPMRSAWTCHPYAEGGHGSLLVDGADDAERERNLRTMIGLAHRAGLQVGVHATGDRSVETFVDTVAGLPDGAAGRHYVIHGDLVNPAQIARMGMLGMGLTTQPVIAVATAEWVTGALGADVAGSAWPLKDLLSSGVTFTLSSDAPVTTPDWRVQLAAACELLGERAPRPGLMTRLLRCYTTAPAVQDGAADWKGSLEVGKAADFCVLDRDPLAVAPAELPEVAIDATVVGGQVVHLREGATLD